MKKEKYTEGILMIIALPDTGSQTSLSAFERLGPDGTGVME